MTGTDDVRIQCRWCARHLFFRAEDALDIAMGFQSAFCACLRNVSWQVHRIMIRRVFS